MKTLYESIKHNIGIGRYAIGNRIIEDGVPCMVIGLKDEHPILLSDVYYEGKWFDTEKHIPKDMSEYGKYSDIMYTYSDFIKMKPEKMFGEGWQLPDEIVYDFDINFIRTHLNYDLRNNYTFRTSFWIDTKKMYKSIRPMLCYDLSNPQQLGEYESKKDVCAVRFVKIIDD